jgi:hypothetical protein
VGLGIKGAVAAGLLLLAACGSSGSTASPTAAPTVINVHSTELDGTASAGFELEVDQIQITTGGWRVRARVTNRTPVTWTVSRPHVPGGTKFGLFVSRRRADLAPARLEAEARTTPNLLATTFRPPVPRVFAPDATWSGWFSGPGRIAAESYVTVAFGRFTAAGRPPAGIPARLLAISANPVQLD